MIVSDKLINECLRGLMKEDKFVEGLSIMNFDSEVEKPKWIVKKPEIP